MRAAEAAPSGLRRIAIQSDRSRPISTSDWASTWTRARAVTVAIGR